jgi:hypothetical protein
MTKLTKVVVGLVVIGVALASAAQVTAYARTRFESYLTNAANSPVMNAYKLSGFNYNGKSLPRMVEDSVKCGQANALTCTLDFARDMFYPFVYASAHTVTASIKLFNDYGDASPSNFSVAGDSFAFGIPTYAQRLVFTVASADTPCGFKVVAFPVPSPE